MIIVQKIPGPLPTQPTTVSHIVPDELLGNLHGENRCRTLVRGTVAVMVR